MGKDIYDDGGLSNFLWAGAFFDDDRFVAQDLVSYTRVLACWVYLVLANTLI